MNRWISIIGSVFMLLTFSCKHPKKNTHADTEGAFFPVISFLKGQVKDIDTSLYRIIKIETVNNKIDTEYIKREDFKNYAREFTDLPDITSDNLKGDYQEAKTYDDALKSYILTYTTNSKDREIVKEDVMINPQPDDMGNSEVKSILIDKWSTHGDSTVHKNLLWQTNKRFLVVTQTEYSNKPEKVQKLEVVWNDYNH
jgi:hypothetical protein